LYASPVAYEVTHIPAGYQTIFYLINPLAALIGAFRWSTLGRPMPPLPLLTWSAAVAVGLFLVGAAVFRRTERKFADAL
jgi:lipopolysaccharide transport system permease protein